MFTKKTHDPTLLEIAIDNAHFELKAHPIESKDFGQAADNIAKLYKLRELDSKKRVTPDVLVTAGANLLGIVMILQHERAHVVASKAVGFVMKLR